MRVLVVYFEDLELDKLVSASWNFALENQDSSITHSIITQQNRQSELK